MDWQYYFQKINKEWDLDDGFLGKVRHRKFDETGFKRLLMLLEEIQILSNEETLDREFVRTIWFIPTFLEWQKPSFREAGLDESQLEVAIKSILTHLTRILGAP